MGRLSVRSRQDALSALKKFFDELVDAQYLDHNAFAKVRVFAGATHDAAGNERRVAAKSRLQIERG
ncbi:phage integrase family protein [Burkholderia ambifaria MEX-5]|uniref:Phage integrase family protein n=1 Tax=Burkholderia ambifaria MEX-5 TaxID=396597 RepID=B1T618_9BURK|nr:phage integrase family protein [Burkholderia ambifaria MEX-5]